MPVCRSIERSFFYSVIRKWIPTLQILVRTQKFVFVGHDFLTELFFSRQDGKDLPKQITFETDSLYQDGQSSNDLPTPKQKVVCNEEAEKIVLQVSLKNIKDKWRYANEILTFSNDIFSFLMNILKYTTVIIGKTLSTLTMRIQ